MEKTIPYLLHFSVDFGKATLKDETAFEEEWETIKETIASNLKSVKRNERSRRTDNYTFDAPGFTL